MKSVKQSGQKGMGRVTQRNMETGTLTLGKAETGIGKRLRKIAQIVSIEKHQCAIINKNPLSFFNVF